MVAAAADLAGEEVSAEEAAGVVRSELYLMTSLRRSQPRDDALILCNTCATSISATLPILKPMRTLTLLTLITMVRKDMVGSGEGLDSADLDSAGLGDHEGLDQVLFGGDRHG